LEEEEEKRLSEIDFLYCCASKLLSGRGPLTIIKTNKLLYWLGATNSLAPISGSRMRDFCQSQPVLSKLLTSLLIMQTHS
jgi:hypothetical protein